MQTFKGEFLGKPKDNKGDNINLTQKACLPQFLLCITSCLPFSKKLQGVLKSKKK